MEKPIDIAIAKKELERIDKELSEPHLLLGGLAVQQYHTARGSKDIDLVCEFELAQRILAKIYPSSDWKIQDAREDEYRPSYRITHKVEDKGEIIFGPKILERNPYNHIDWHELRNNSKPFSYRNKKFQNILIPSAAGLAFTKIISFIGRSDKSSSKVGQDLTDFVDLSNNEEFSISEFYDKIRKSGAQERIRIDFPQKVVPQIDILKNSSIWAVAELLGMPSLTKLEPSIVLNNSKITKYHIDGITKNEEKTMGPENDAKGNNYEQIERENEKLTSQLKYFKSLKMRVWAALNKSSSVSIDEILYFLEIHREPEAKKEVQSIVGLLLEEGKIKGSGIGGFCIIKKE